MGGFISSGDLAQRQHSGPERRSRWLGSHNNNSLAANLPKVPRIRSQSVCLCSRTNGWRELASELVNSRVRSRPSTLPLKKAQAQARVPPIESRLKVVEEYLTRKKKRFSESEEAVAEAIAKRDRLRSKVEEGEKSLARLKEEQQRFPQVFVPSAMDITAPATSTLVAEVEQLQTMVAQLRAQNEELMSSSKRQAVNPGVNDCSGRLREDFVPMCDEKAAQWIRDRQADMQDATSVGNAHELARLCHVVANAADQLSRNSPSVVANVIK